MVPVPVPVVPTAAQSEAVTECKEQKIKLPVDNKPLYKLLDHLVRVSCVLFPIYIIKKYYLSLTTRLKFCVAA